MNTGLKLYTSYCKQLTDKGVKGDWVLYDKDHKQINKFPAEYDEKRIFEILDFAKKFEKIAFNKGIDFEKNTLRGIKSNASKNVIVQLKNENILLLKENERIGGKLDELLTFKEN